MSGRTYYGHNERVTKTEICLTENRQYFLYDSKRGAGKDQNEQTSFLSKGDRKIIWNIMHQEVFLTKNYL